MEGVVGPLFERVLDTDQRDAVERFFDLPTADFGPYNILVFSDASRACQQYRLTKDQAKERLLQMSPTQTVRVNDVTPMRVGEN